MACGVLVLCTYVLYVICITDSFLIIFVIFSNLNYFNCDDPGKFNTCDPWQMLIISS